MKAESSRLISPKLLVESGAGRGRVSTVMRAGAGQERVELGAGRAEDKNFFVGVSECWLNACESDMCKKLNATKGLWYEGVKQLCQPKCLTGPKIMSVS